MESTTESNNLNNNMKEPKDSSNFNTDVIAIIIKNIILGIERSIYNDSKTDNDLKANYNKPTAMLIGHKKLEMYFDKTLHKLNQKDKTDLDPQTADLLECIFSISKKKEKHGFLLNIIVNLTMFIYEKVPRSKLKQDNDEAFETSFADVLALMDKFILYSINRKIEEVEQCYNNPNKK